MLPSLLNPLFLAGLLLLALPILLHLFRREREGGSGFPSLMFIRRMPQPLKSQLRLRHRWLLLLRCLLLSLLILAFARPFLSGAADFVANAGDRDTVLVLDRSYSMSRGENWQAATGTIRRLIDERVSGERMALLTFDERSEIVVDWTLSASDLLAALRRLQPGHGSTRVRGAIEQANRLLAGSIAATKRIVVISDFPGSFLAEPLPQLSAGVIVETLPLQAPTAGNSLRLLSVEAQQQSVSVDVEVSRFGTPANLNLVLESNGRAIDNRQLLLQPGQTEKIRYDNLEPDTAGMTGKIVAGSTENAAGDQLQFVYSNQQRLPVLLISNRDSRRLQSFYLEQALLQMRQPSARVDRLAWSQIDPQTFQDYRVIVINDAPMPRGSTADALKNFVSAGGGLLLATGESTRNRWPAESDSILPGESAGRSETGETRITSIDSSHPLLARAGSDSIDLSATRFYQRHQLQAGEDDRVIATFADGSAALLERQIGWGRIIMLPTTLDLHWNDLALQPTFLPLLHGLISYLGDHQAVPAAYTVGETVDLLAYSRALQSRTGTAVTAGNRHFTVESPSGRQIRLPQSNPLLTVTESGIYQIHRSGGGNRPVNLAVNIDPLELEPSSLDDKAWSSSLQTTGRGLDRLATESLNQQMEDNQGWWRVLFWCVLMLLLLEFFLSNRLLPGRAAGLR